MDRMGCIPNLSINVTVVIAVVMESIGVNEPLHTLNILQKEHSLLTDP